MAGELGDPTQAEVHDDSCRADVDPVLLAPVDGAELADRRAQVVSAAFAAMIDGLGVRPAPGQL